jgi:transposase-like protein
LVFPVTYRDLALMLLDRGVPVDHATIFRWIQAYPAELEKRGPSASGEKSSDSWTRRG